MLSNLQTYLERLSQLRQNTQATGELSLRPALDELFQSLKPDGVDFVGEGKQLASGRPDFTFTRGVYNEPIGYVEAEKVAANLSKLTGHAKAQNERFAADLDNFLLTNHFDFRLYDSGKEVESVVLPEKGAELTEQHQNDFARLWERFTETQIAAPKTPNELATLLARRARTLRLAIEDSLGDADSPLLEDLTAFRRLLLPDLNPHDFANLYAETLTYGLFAARCQMPEGKRFNPHNADKSLRRTPLLRTLYRLFEADVPANLEWILDDMAAILNGAAIDEIRNYFENRAGRPDPMIDFYEPFLAQYDAKARQSRGVYYTPEPVVSYIVRSVHALLQDRFDLADGVAGGAKILDPATGTGSFLFAVVDQMHKEIGAGSWKSFVRDKKPLDNLFGFELMVAPYTVAHLKVALQMEGLGTPLNEGERVGIYLTNTLDDARRQSEALLESSIAEEVNAAADVKEKAEILVVLGNPPYSGVSANSPTKMQGDERILTGVGEQIESYKIIDGVPMGERNPKWLQDDYVKFLAFAQRRIEKSGEGIVAFITPHGYLDNPTFRGMRRSFLKTFSALYLLDLHGNSNKKEVAPDGSADKNVFDIKQGVAILLAVKQKGTTGEAQVFHADLWGDRESKNVALLAEDVNATKWQELTPKAPMFFFVPRDEALALEYEKLPKVTDIFPEGSAGLVTARDALTIHFSSKKVWETVQDFASLPVEAARQKYELGDDARDWKVNLAQEDLRKTGLKESDITPILYRPFDVRSTYYTGHSRGFICMPRAEIMQNFIGHGNIGLIATRQTRDQFDVFATQHICGHKTCSSYDVNTVFPLYLYSEGLFGAEKRPNIAPDYMAKLTAITGEAPTPEEVFGYVYARLNGPKYRQMFAELLKTDFPRVPMPTTRKQFEQFAKLGAELVALHTLDTKAAPALKEKRHDFSPGSDAVEKVTYDAGERRIMINETQGFGDVDAEVYAAKIGGYTVADKWLADRKGRTLSFDEQRLYPQILIALAETRRVMSVIEALEIDTHRVEMLNNGDFETNGEPR